MSTFVQQEILQGTASIKFRVIMESTRAFIATYSTSSSHDIGIESL
jgi:hypothetical protein